jgi:hypothetical protein
MSDQSRADADRRARIEQIVRDLKSTRFDESSRRPAPLKAEPKPDSRQKRERRKRER